MAVTYTLTSAQCDDWIHWEQGMVRVIPSLSMIAWMRERGYHYDEDWTCTRTNLPLTAYMFVFPSEEIKTMFLLKWL